MYTEKVGGKLSAAVFGFLLILAWGQLAYEAKIISEDNMTGSKREQFLKSRQGLNAGRNRQRNAGPMTTEARQNIDPEVALAPSILQNRN